jgi:hypothetical protein
VFSFWPSGHLQLKDVITSFIISFDTDL